MLKITFALSTMILLGLFGPTSASCAEQKKLPTKEQLAKDNKLFLTLATQALHWRELQEPFHIAGPLYFVGTKGLSSFLFKTTDGLILLNTGDPTSGPMIEASIKKLGLDPKNIKIMINGHGHSDHAGGFAYLKKLSDAKLAIMEGDVAMIEDGGKSDFHYGHDWEIMGQEPVKVDRVLSNGDRVTLGEATLTAYHTPGQSGFDHVGYSSRREREDLRGRLPGWRWFQPRVPAHGRCI
ncbi:MBL fold metallo-hydrolase [Rhizobium acaciae]|uniref:MBL fold metallo-hydrolase n=1 Tax=Rhizobium acaciae TaxID=2989736 RepID=UPI003F949C94